VKCQGFTNADLAGIPLDKKRTSGATFNVGFVSIS